MQTNDILTLVILGFAIIGVIATVRWLCGIARKLVSAQPKPVQPSRTRKPAKRTAGYVIDGSNVLFWAGEGPELASIQAVVKRLKASGKALHVFFDATVGYKLFDRHASDAQMAQHLGLTPDQVTIVPGGTDADVFILKHAARHRDTVVSNDRFKDNGKLAKGLPRLRGVVSAGRATFDS